METKDLLDLKKLERLENYVNKKHGVKTISKILKRLEESDRKYLARIPRSYRVYVKSKFWEKRKKAYYKKYGRQCEICISPRFVHLHHKLYGDYGFEKDENLVALCDRHHEQLHIAIGRVKKNMVKETDDFIREMKECLAND